MAFRFGRSHWQDSDRLNLVTVCQKHQQWDQRLQEMRQLYAKSNFPPGYFTENSCREELERLLSLPTPNLRLDVSKQFVYSRKIMMDKWIEHLRVEVKKQRAAQAELSLVQVRNNTKLIKEALDPKTSAARLQELVELAKQCAERHKNDANYKRTVGSLDAAITEKLRSKFEFDLDAMVLPPTRPPGEDHVTGSRGFLTPTHSSADFHFSSPMLSLAEAVRDAAPLPAPPVVFVEPEPPAVSVDELPADIMEPPATPVKDEFPSAAAAAAVVPPSPSPSPQKKTPQKKPEPSSQLEVKLEEAAIKEEEEATAQMTPSPSATPRGRGRPRILQVSTGSSKNAPTPSRETPSRAGKRPSSPETAQPTVTPTLPKKARNQPVTTTTTTSARKRKEETEEPTPSAHAPPSEVSFDTQTAPGTPDVDNLPPFREMEVQTDITIRQIMHDPPMGERRRSNAPPAFRKSRKSMGQPDAAAAAAARSVSRNSSTASAPATVVTKNASCQTNGRFDIDKDDVVLMRIDTAPKVFYTIHELDRRRPIVVNQETCREIATENAASGDNSYEMGKRATKVETKKDITMIIEADEAIGKQLIEEKSFQLVSQTSDMPSAGPNDSPVKRSRRDDKVKDDVTNMKYQLQIMFRALYECEWSELFKKPVPPGEVHYDHAVFQRIDLSMIKKEIESGQIASVQSFLHRAYRMLSNAIMYNGYDHDVNIQAKSIIEQVMVDITTVLQPEERRGVTGGPSTQPRRSRQTEEQRPTSRCGSMEPEPMTPLGTVGTKRSVFRKEQNTDHLTSQSGNRKAKKNLK